MTHIAFEDVRSYFEGLERPAIESLAFEVAKAHEAAHRLVETTEEYERETIGDDELRRRIAEMDSEPGRTGPPPELVRMLSASAWLSLMAHEIERERASA